MITPTGVTYCEHGINIKRFRSGRSGKTSTTGNPTDIDSMLIYTRPNSYEPIAKPTKQNNNIITKSENCALSSYSKTEQTQRWHPH